MKKNRYRKLYKLKGRITEKGETYRSISEQSFIPINSLSNKINGHYLFDINEVAILCNLLDIDAKQIPDYFFKPTLRFATKTK